MKVKINNINKTLCSVAAMALLVFTGCTQEEVYTDTASTAQKMELGAAYPTVTRATSAGFADKDMMGIYVVDYENGQPGVMLPKGNRASNVRYTFHESDNRWEGAADIYWKDDKTPVDIYGYYPFIPQIEELTQYPFSVVSKQNQPGSREIIGGYEASDFLWAKAAQVKPTKEIISLMYRHIMAGVTVRLEQGPGFTDQEWATLDKKVFVMNTLTNATIDFSTGKVTAVEGTTESIYPFSYNDEYRAVVVPQTMQQGTELLSLLVGSKSYSYKKEKTLVYEAGKMHNFTIRVKKEESTGDYIFELLGEDITAWVDDAEFHEGIIRDYLVVQVDKPGTLQQKLVEMGKNPAHISNLKVVGKLSAFDTEFMRNQMESLMNLNLKDVIFCDGNGIPDYRIPENAFANKLNLTHIVLPDKLVEIGNQSFFRTNIMGDLVIPEGVTRIGFEAFAGCGSLKGQLSLPSTLKIIDGSAFQYTCMTCELKLPEGLEGIGGAALASTFTGNLVLPQSIKYVGPGAFTGCNFVGDLVIPQGMRVIQNQSFHNCGLDGNLELPEGIMEIGQLAFTGCRFKGELKLPKSLQFIGDRAFMENDFSKVIFPENVAFIGDEAFAACKRLRGIIEWPSNVDLISSGTFADCSMLDGIIIPSTVTRIDRNAFFGCHVMNSVVCQGEEPPLLHKNAFWGIARDNFSIEVPAKAVEAYQAAPNWKEFKRITAYSNFVCRPQHACAINSARNQELVLNADGPWEVSSCPDWCTITPKKGTGKSKLTLNINELAQGSQKRIEDIVFTLTESGVETKCKVSQYNYEYAEDQCIELQKSTKGSGEINLLFLGDGFDAEVLASGKYLDIVKQQMECFFAIEPYKTYREYFNVHANISLSQEVGINTLNTYRNTCFQSIYGGCSDQILVNDKLVFDYVKAYSPVNERNSAFSTIILVPNTTDYGGNTVLYEDGSAVAVCPPSENPSDMRAIVQHEAGGHGFGKLGDENIKKNLFAPNYVHGIIGDAHSRGWYQNVSSTGNMKEVPWAHFIFDPRYSDEVDIYEGGMEYTRGVFRSEINSCMNYGIPYYNAISRQDIVRRILDYSREGFTMEKFLATDTKNWGPAIVTRALPYDARPASMSHHIAPKFVNKYPFD